MRRLAAVLFAAALALAAVAACTPTKSQQMRLAALSARDAGLAARVAADYQAQKARALQLYPCGGHFDVAMSAGFSPAEWPILSTIIKRETGGTCRDDLVGRVGEVGATQVYPRVWLASLCAAGIACTTAELAQPERNLLAARFVFLRQGWTAWTTCDPALHPSCD